jgi:hypothetical protein
MWYTNFQWINLYFVVMDALVNPLEKSVTNKTKPDVVKQEVDCKRHDSQCPSCNWLAQLDQVWNSAAHIFFPWNAHEIFCLVVNILTIYPLGFDGTEQLSHCLTAVSLLHDQGIHEPCAEVRFTCWQVQYCAPWEWYCRWWGYYGLQLSVTPWGYNVLLLTLGTMVLILAEWIKMV